STLTILGPVGTLSACATWTLTEKPTSFFRMTTAQLLCGPIFRQMGLTTDSILPHSPILGTSIGTSYSRHRRPSIAYLPAGGGWEVPVRRLQGAYAIRALPDLCLGIVSERLEFAL